MTSSTEAVAEAMDAILNAPMNRISEALFKTRYLPLFTGEKTEATFEEWIKVAGSAFRSVDVVDHTNKLIYTVPKLLSDSDDYLEELKKVGVMQQMQLAEQKAASLPMLGELHIQKYLIEKVKESKPDWDSIRLWNNIFRRYGRPEIPTPESRAAAKPITDEASDLGSNPKNEFDDIFGADLRN